MLDDEITRRFVARLGQEVPRLPQTHVFDIHFDELCAEPMSYATQLQQSWALFAWTLDHCSEPLSGLLVMLSVWLTPSKQLDLIVPSWSSLPDQMTMRPPSIYVLPPRSCFDKSSVRSYRAGADTPALPGKQVVPEYVCWRDDEDPDDEWGRELRVTSPQFLPLSPR